MDTPAGTDRQTASCLIEYSSTCTHSLPPPSLTDSLTHSLTHACTNILSTITYMLPHLLYLIQRAACHAFAWHGAVSNLYSRRIDDVQFLQRAIMNRSRESAWAKIGRLGFLENLDNLCFVSQLPGHPTEPGSSLCC